MERGLGGERVRKVFGVHASDEPRIERSSKAALQLGGAGERPLQRDLLVEDHADQQRERLGREEGVGFWILTEVKLHTTERT